MNKTANIRYADRNMFIKTPYDAAFVAELKSAVKARKWNPESKEWVIDIKERAIALELVKRYYDVIEDNEIPEIPLIPKSQVTASGNALLQTEVITELLSGGNLEIWTDGACLGNPGPGGYGIIFKCNGQTQAKSGGFSLTTNNRMEIMAAIVALETLKEKAKVVIYSDSRYLVDAMMKGWAKKWKANKWMRTSKDKAINPDLWDRLLQLCDLYAVEFRWVRGHDSQTENEWCDQLAVAAARQPDLPVDAGYKKANGIGTIEKYS
jgi:ribonuclease HI